MTNTLYHFDVFQDEALRTAIYPNLGENIYYPALGLAGEVGEVCEKIKKIMRDDAGYVDYDSKTELKKELGDVLWYLAALAHELDIPFGEIPVAVLEKLQSRQDRGVLGGSGDNR